MRFWRRTTTPGPFPHYGRFKPFLREDFRFRCACCYITEGYRKGNDVFGVDHFRPQRDFPELVLEYTNLYYACHGCNSTKGRRFPTTEEIAAGNTFVDSCAVDPFAGDYQEEIDGTLTGISTTGRFTIRILSLNRPACVAFRQRRRNATALIQSLEEKVSRLPRGPGRQLAEPVPRRRQGRLGRMLRSVPAVASGPAR